jgi:16S rRNA (cytosine1402-N4)-methyltransferase
MDANGGTGSHISVLLEESLEYLAVRAEGIYVDATCGGGGHSARIAARLTTGQLLAMDQDQAALDAAGPQLAAYGARVRLLRARFSRLKETLAGAGMEKVDGILADLGMSQMQLDDAGRGFSFAAEGSLDLRMDTSRALTAAEVVNRMGERELADVLYQYAEERRSRRIAKAIVRARPIPTARRLAEVVSAALRGSPQGRIHPATRTFQALRMYVNDEPGELRALLEQIPAVTRAGARIVIISFHSGEDRMVKNAFRSWQAQGVCRVLTRHVVRPSPREIAGNPRSRSARLRCAERI